MSCNTGDEGGQSWVAASTHPHKEPTAISNLLRQGFEAYCPMVRRRWRHARKVQEVLRPLFPGYVFVAVDPSQHRWRPILSTVGVRTLVRFGDSLGLLPHGFVESLRSYEVEGAVSLLLSAVELCAGRQGTALRWALRGPYRHRSGGRGACETANNDASAESGRASEGSRQFGRSG